MKLALPVFNFSIQNKTSDNSMDVYVDGLIVDPETEQILKDWFGDETSLSYRTFRNKVTEVNPKLLNIYVNSPGGHVGDALAMHDFLKEVQNNGTVVKTFTIGMCASAATYFQLAVPMENRYASANSFGLIHNVSGGVYGDLRTMQSYVNMAEKMNKNVINLYVSNTKLTHQKVTDMMDAETLLTAQEMLDYGFIGNISTSASVKNTVDVSKLGFKNQAVLNAYKNFSQNNISDMDTSKITEAINNAFAPFLEKLGLSNKKDDEGIQNAIKEFSGSITNAIKENIPSDEAIANKATEILTNALAEGGAIMTAIKNSIPAAIDTTNFVTKDQVANHLTKEQFTNEFSTAKADLTKAITDKLGNGAGGNSTENKSKKVPNNKFAKANLEE